MSTERKGMVMNKRFNQPLRVFNRQKAIIGFSVCALLLSVVGCTTVSDEIQGVWERDSRTGAKGMKVIMDGKWFIMYYDEDSGLVRTFHGGSYTIEDNRYMETFEFASKSTESWIGKNFTFDVSVDGDTYHQEGVENTFTEDWQRLR